MRHINDGVYCRNKYYYWLSLIKHSLYIGDPWPMTYTTCPEMILAKMEKKNMKTVCSFEKLKSRGSHISLNTE